MNGAAIMMCYMVAITAISWKLHTFVGRVNSLSTFHTIASENQMSCGYIHMLQSFVFGFKFLVYYSRNANDSLT